MQLAGSRFFQNRSSLFDYPWRTWLTAIGGLVLWALLILTITYQWQAHTTITLGDYYDPPFLQGNFSPGEVSQGNNRSFRWTTGDATIAVPLAGRGSWTTKIDLLTQHPDASPVNAVLDFGSNATIALPDTNETRIIHALIPANATSSGNVALGLRSNLYQEQTASARTLGIAVFNVDLASTESRPFLPPLLAVVLLSLILLGIAASILLTGINWPWAVGLSAAIGVGLALPVMLARVPHTFWLPNLAVLAGLSVGLIAALRKIVPWLMRKGGIELEPHTLTILLGLFLFGFWIKAAGQVYPYMIAIDIHWHMERVRWILDGRLAEMYKPGAFNESVMPEKEFGKERPIIPYSPFFHIFATSFALLPFQMETTAKIFSSIIDSSYIFLIYFYARSFSFPLRVGLLAAAFYNVVPLTYLLHSWGNVPTTFGMWWTFMSIAFVIGAWGKLDQRKVWWSFAALLTVAFLMYTVMAVFLGMLLCIWMSYIAITKRNERRQARSVITAMLVGVLGSTIVYYGLYIPGIIEKTIPYFTTTFTEGQAAVGAVQYQPTAYDNFLAYRTRLWNHGLTVPFLLLPFALWVIARLRTRQPESRLWMGSIWMCAMVTVSLLFTVIDRTVPMVDKHIIFLIPVWAILMAMLMDLALKRWRWSSIIFGLAYLGLFAMSIELWTRRIASVKQIW
ncbi:hypothetical protein ACP8Y2_20965 [Herpetosiphon llansteffanensis]